MQDRLTSFFWSGDAIRSRHVSNIVHTATLDVPAPSLRLQADWDREIASNMDLEPGDVDVMPFARARARWPEYPRCVEAVAEWAAKLGLPGVLAESDVALMACRGARYHHDGAQYGGAAFCNLFMSEDRELDLHFPSLDLRIPLRRGTAVIFDTGQPHGVIPRGSSGFNAEAFAPDQDFVQVFLTWELSIETLQVGHALNVTFDVEPTATLQDIHEEQIRLNGEAVTLSPETGRWGRVE